MQLPQRQESTSIILKEWYGLFYSQEMLSTFFINVKALEGKKGIQSATRIKRFFLFRESSFTMRTNCCRISLWTISYCECLVTRQGNSGNFSLEKKENSKRNNLLYLIESIKSPITVNFCFQTPFEYFHFIIIKCSRFAMKTFSFQRKEKSEKGYAEGWAGVTMKAWDTL